MRNIPEETHKQIVSSQCNIQLPQLEIDLPVKKQQCVFGYARLETCYINLFIPQIAISISGGFSWKLLDTINPYTDCPMLKGHKCNSSESLFNIALLWKHYYWVWESNENPRWVRNHVHTNRSHLMSLCQFRDITGSEPILHSIYICVTHDHILEAAT